MTRAPLPITIQTTYGDVVTFRDLWRGDTQQLAELDVRVRVISGADQYRRTHPELVR